ncbi:hypothetical protein [Aquirhabdus sp.]|uniref:hypothetical protein n=1 Tax=Aquirhabdus sp. TaxID=2824160 RepID=UPI00396C997A
MKSKALIVASAISILGGIGLTSPAQAYPHYGRNWAGAYHFHYNPVGWRGGYWRQGWHGGHYGWWWGVGGAWLLYPAPIYPYPDPELEPAYVVSEPVTTIVESQPAQPLPQTAPTPVVQTVWYYCSSPQGYYPNVPSCPSGWQKTPVKPSDAR